MSLMVTTLIENDSVHPSLEAEHGLSMLIEYNQLTILFDTGSSGAFINNARQLQKDLTKLDYLILSHGHDDHTGGVERLLNEFMVKCPIVIGDGFFEDKYKRDHENFIYDGNPFTANLFKDKTIITVKNDIIQLSAHVYVLSSFKHENSFEKPNNKYFLKTDYNYVLDTFKEEVALIIEMEQGLVVFLGCSHVGMINILETIVMKFKKAIYGVIGGSHLIRADEDRIEKTVNYLKDNKITFIALSHCTGANAVASLKTLPQFVNNHTGTIIEIK